jgi:serine/threonine protein phosphatase PrpC
VAVLLNGTVSLKIECLCVYFDPNAQTLFVQVVVGNVGDSRAVLCRGGAAVPLSMDHTPKREDEGESNASLRRMPRSPCDPPQCFAYARLAAMWWREMWWWVGRSFRSHGRLEIVW